MIRFGIVTKTSGILVIYSWQFVIDNVDLLKPGLLSIASEQILLKRTVFVLAVSYLLSSVWEGESLAFPAAGLCELELLKVPHMGDICLILHMLQLSAC